MKTISICNSEELSVSGMILIVHLKRWSGTLQRFCREDIYHNPSNSSSLIMIQLWIHSDSTSSSFLDPSRLHRLEQCDWFNQSVIFLMFLRVNLMKPVMKMLQTYFTSKSIEKIRIYVYFLYISYIISLLLCAFMSYEHFSPKCSI